METEAGKLLFPASWQQHFVEGCVSFLFFFFKKKLNHKDSKQELCWHQEVEGSEKQLPNSIW